MELNNYNDYILLTKKYLRNYNKFKLTAQVLEKDIQNRERLLDDSLDINASIARYGDGPSGGHSELNAIEAACERRLKTAREVQDKKRDLASLRCLLDKVEAAFMVVDCDIRDIVTDYYVDGYSWEQVSVKHHYSARWCREKCKTAVEDMAAVIFGLKSQPLQLSFVFAQ